MATAGEMTRVVADALIMQTATVTSYYRMLRREDGLVTQGGRGRSAAHMTSDDVASLLITVMGSEKLEEATAMCRLLTATVGVYGITADGERTEVEPHITLVEAIGRLLQQVRPRHTPLKDPPMLPFLGDVSLEGLILEICGSTLESNIQAGDRLLEFLSLEERVPITAPDDWSSLDMKQELLAKAEQGGMLTKRSIDRTALIRLSLLLPE
jgi:hypothetical protein